MFTIGSNAALSEKHALVLSRLSDMGAATPAELEIQSGLIGGNVERVLDELKEHGLVDFRARRSGADSVRIYYRTAPAASYR